MEINRRARRARREKSEHLSLTPCFSAVCNGQGETKTVSTVSRSPFSPSPVGTDETSLPWFLNAYYRVALLNLVPRFLTARSVAFHCRRTIGSRRHGRRAIRVGNRENKPPVDPVGRVGQGKCIPCGEHRHVKNAVRAVQLFRVLGLHRKGCIYPAHSTFEIARQPTKFVFSSVGFRTECSERPGRSGRTQHVFVLQQDVGTSVEKLASNFIQFEPPRGWVVTDPLQKVWKRVGSDMANSFLGLTVALWRSVPRKLQNPLTQPLAPILRLPLTPSSPNQQPNEHPNPNHHRINSSRPHGANIMPIATRTTSRKQAKQLENWKPGPTFNVQHSTFNFQPPTPLCPFVSLWFMPVAAPLRIRVHQCSSVVQKNSQVPSSSPSVFSAFSAVKFHSVCPSFSCFSSISWFKIRLLPALLPC